VDLDELSDPAFLEQLGQEMFDLMVELFPVCRSITGEGLRQTLRTIGTRIPLAVTEVPTGTAVFDWTVPPEWNVRDAWVADADGRRVIDFRASNLHVVNYSTPVRRRLPLAELDAHLHSLPDHPTWVPYRTSYYVEDWGFCLSDQARRELPDGDYEAVIDTTLEDGSLSYGECVLGGESPDEILVSCHVCHPSLANDNLSAVVAGTFLARLAATLDRRLTYRFLFAPGTIGAITWLARNQHRVGHIRAGLVLACVGDDTPLVYKRSRRGDTEIDRAAAHVLGHHDPAAEIVDFSPYGNDERQFCSPGFNLPVGAITRAGHDRNERHHTSADDLASISPLALADTVATCLRIIGLIERNDRLVSLNPMGEPQLGRRGLYRSFGGRAEQAALESAVLWVMSGADGHHTVLDVAERARLPFAVVDEAARALVDVGLIERVRCTPTGEGNP
jgi:aminopeptidase-like protein